MKGSLRHHLSPTAPSTRTFSLHSSNLSRTCICVANRGRSWKEFLQHVCEVARHVNRNQSL